MVPQPGPIRGLRGSVRSNLGAWPRGRCEPPSLLPWASHPDRQSSLQGGEGSFWSFLSPHTLHWKGGKGQSGLHRDLRPQKWLKLGSCGQRRVW